MSPSLYTKKPTEEEMVTGCVWMGLQAPAQMSNEDWVKEQGLDPDIAQIIQLYHEKQSFRSRVTPDGSQALKVMLRHR